MSVSVCIYSIVILGVFYWAISVAILGGKRLEAFVELNDERLHPITVYIFLISRRILFWSIEILLGRPMAEYKL